MPAILQRTAITSRVLDRPHLVPDIARDVHKRPVDSFRCHLVVPARSGPSRAAERRAEGSRREIPARHLTRVPPLLPPRVRQPHRGLELRLLRSRGSGAIPRTWTGILVDLLEEVDKFGGWIEMIVAVPASVAVRPEQSPGARGGVVAKLGDRHADRRTRPPPSDNGRRSTIVMVAARVVTSRHTSSRTSAGRAGRRIFGPWRPRGPTRERCG